MSTLGEVVARRDFSKSQFYSNRKKLIEAGVSWHNTNMLIIDQDGALPRDFVPMQRDSRRCTGKVSENSIFNYDPVERYRLMHAA